MHFYRQTSKALDIFLSREERLVYTLCREAVSDLVLAQRTQLAPETLQQLLAHLLEQGLIEEVGANQEPAPPPPATPDQLAIIQARLLTILQEELGERASQFALEVERKEDIKVLEEWSRRLVLKLRLTMSQKAADALEARLQSLFS
jgi:hypothetical protein